MQKWKNDPKLYGCETENNQGQINKKLDYYTTYKTEFLEQDEKKDWESIEGCEELWYFTKKAAQIKRGYVLDVGTKDGQFTAYFDDKPGFECIGIELADDYVKYAQDKGRNVIKGDVCNLDFEDNHFDVVFSHHVLGLTPDYKKAIQEMYRVCKSGGIITSLNHIPGNKRKHFSYIESPKIIKGWLTEDWFDGEIIFFDYSPWKGVESKEFIFILQKN